MESNELRVFGIKGKERAKQKINSEIKDSSGIGVFLKNIRISGYSLSSSVTR